MLFCAMFADLLRRIAEIDISHVKLPTSIAEIGGDDESAQEMFRITSKSWLEKLPT